MHQALAIHKIQHLKRGKIAQPLWQSMDFIKSLYPQNFKGNKVLNLVQERVECRLCSRPTQLELLEGVLNGSRRQTVPTLQILKKRAKRLAHCVVLQLLWTGNLAKTSAQDNSLLPTSEGKDRCAVNLANNSA